MIRKYLLCLFVACAFFDAALGGNAVQPGADFAVKGFHLDLRMQVMKMDALKAFAQKLHEAGLNTLIMEWEGTFPFEKHPLISQPLRL